MAEILDFVEYKAIRDEKIRIAEIKIAIAKKIAEVRKMPNDVEKFNQNFFEIVDIFMAENYPDYQGRFALFLKKYDIK